MLFHVPAAKCPVLEAPKNGQLTCFHRHGNFTYNSICAFSCDVGFVMVGSEMLNCTALGEWTGSAPFCKGQASCGPPGGAGVACMSHGNSEILSIGLHLFVPD